MIRFLCMMIEETIREGLMIVSNTGMVGTDGMVQKVGVCGRI